MCYNRHMIHFLTWRQIEIFICQKKSWMLSFMWATWVVFVYKGICNYTKKIQFFVQYFGYGLIFARCMVSICLLKTKNLLLPTSIGLFLFTKEFRNYTEENLPVQLYSHKAKLWPWRHIVIWLFWYPVLKMWHSSEDLAQNWPFV